VKRTNFGVRVLRVAANDLADIASYISVDDATAAETFLERIEKNLANLESHPRLGSIPNDEELGNMGYRFLVVEDYLIFYTVRKKEILIHRVIHGARNYKNLL
jgi:toxin ParE1/3/4